MNIYTSEDMREFVKEHLASGIDIVKCRSKNAPNNRQTFICIKETMDCRMDWRGETRILAPGDYIHADPNDFYPLAAEQFAACYVIIN